MLRRLACAVAVLGVTLTLANAEEIKGTILKVSDKSVTVRLKAKEKGMKGEEKTYDLGKAVKVSLKEGKESKEVAGGLKSDLVTGLDAKKGQGGTVITDSDNRVTEIIFNAPKKKVDKKKADAK